VPEIDDPTLPPAAKALCNPLNGLGDRLTAAIQNIGVHIPLQRDTAVSNSDGTFRIMRPVEADDLVAGLAQLVESVPSALGKYGHGDGLAAPKFPNAGGEARGYPTYVGERERAEVVRRQLAGPRVEDLQHLRARQDLPRQEFDADVRDPGQQGVRGGGVLEDPGLDEGEGFAAPALDHVAQEGPRRADEADQRDPARELSPCQADGVEDVGELCADVHFRLELREVFRLAQRVGEVGPLRLEHFHGHPHCLRDHEDVGEDYGCVD